MSAALQLVDSPAQYDTRQLDILKRTIATGLDDNEFGLLVEVSRRTGLDLFARQLYGIKRGGKMTLQTGIDGYRLMAARTGALAGIDDATYDDESGKHPGKASVTVWRFVQGQRVPFSATARWSEYSQQSGGMWDKMPYLMLAKCAEALALRKAFPAELSGVYTGEEMQQADDTPFVEQAASQPAQRAPRTVVPMVNASDGQISMQKLYDRFKALGFPASEWTEAKRKYASDVDELAKYVGIREGDRRIMDAQAQARARGEDPDAVLDLFGAFGDGPLS